MEFFKQLKRKQERVNIGTTTTNKHGGNKQKINNKVVNLNLNMSINTLNVYGINTLIKRQRLSE